MAMNYYNSKETQSKTATISKLKAYLPCLRYSVLPLNTYLTRIHTHTLQFKHFLVLIALFWLFFILLSSFLQDFTPSARLVTELPETKEEL